MRTALGTIVGEPMLRTTMQKSVLATCTRIKSIIPCCVAPFHRDGHVPWANVCSLLQANMSKYESSTSRCTTQGWSSHMVFATYHLSLYCTQCVHNCHLDTILPILLAEPACTARHTSAPMQPVKPCIQRNAQLPAQAIAKIASSDMPQPGAQQAARNTPLC